MRSPPSVFERAPPQSPDALGNFGIPSRGNDKEIQRRRRLLAAVTALCERINTALAGSLIELDKEFGNAVKNVLVRFDAILRNIAWLLTARFCSDGYLGINVMLIAVNLPQWAL
jgi:hypothetical protein